jgi:Periplasmic copper-binding protein (NosD)
MRVVQRHVSWPADSRAAGGECPKGICGRRRRVRRVVQVIVGSSLLVGGAWLPRLASAATLSCGSVLTASVTLTSNLDCRAQTWGSGLTIGAAHVTVNLNGYTISGPSNVVGIEDVGYSYPTIEGGKMSGIGVDLQGTEHPDGMVTAILGATIRHVTFTGAGISLTNARGAHITHNTVVAFDNIGITDYSNTADIISHNHIRVSSSPTSSATGIDVYGTTNEVIRDNTIEGAGGDYSYGIVDYYSTGEVTTHNTVSDLYTGILESDEDGTVSYNQGRHDAYGIDEEGAIGIEYVGNHFGWGHYGMWLYDPSGTRLTHNVTNHNSRAGVVVFVDQIYCGPCSATLGRNIANDNARGLYSRIKTIGSGNHAVNNRVVNCHHVACVPTRSAAAFRTVTGLPSPAESKKMTADRSRTVSDGGDSIARIPARVSSDAASASSHLPPRRQTDCHRPLAKVPPCAGRGGLSARE